MAQQNRRCGQATARRARQRRRRLLRRQDKITLQGVTGITLCLCIVLLIQTFRLYQEHQELKKTQEALLQELTEEEERTLEIEEYADYMSTLDFIEEMARRKLGLVYPDEIILKEAE